MQNVTAKLNHAAELLAQSYPQKKDVSMYQMRIEAVTNSDFEDAVKEVGFALLDLKLKGII